MASNRMTNLDWQDPPRGIYYSSWRPWHNKIVTVEKSDQVVTLFVEPATPGKCKFCMFSLPPFCLFSCFIPIILYNSVAERITFVRQVRVVNIVVTINVAVVVTIAVAIAIDVTIAAVL